jgi:hypothetical protein
MSKADSIQAKLWKAYGKVGKVLGYPHELYRTDHLSVPIQSKNFIDTKNVAFSLNDKFSQTPGSGVDRWKTWVDGRLESHFDIQPGDFLVNIETHETYFVGNSEKHSYIISVRANTFLSVYNTVYETLSTGFGGSDNEIAYNVPAHLLVSSFAGNDLNYIPGPTYNKDTVLTGEIYIIDPARTVQVGMNVRDSNNILWDILSIDESSLGIKLQVQSIKVEQ